MSDDLHSSTNNLQDKYRLVIMNDDTFEEVTSYRLTRLNGYLALGGLLLGALFVAWLLLAFTPLRRTLPGDYINPKDVYVLQSKIDTLEQVLEAQSSVMVSRERWLSGDYESGPGEYIEISEPTKIEEVAPIAEDLALREKYNNERKGNKENDEEGEESSPIPKLVKRVLVATNYNGMAQQYIAPPIMGGHVTDQFDMEKKHYGIDITAPRNTPVQSILEGTVISSDETMDTGKVIVVQHKDNLVSFYKHNSVLLKKVGNFVNAGEAIAIIGNTGEMSDGPHLHFELWQNGKPVDPNDYIDF